MSDHNDNYSDFRDWMQTTQVIDELRSNLIKTASSAAISTGFITLITGGWALFPAIVTGVIGGVAAVAPSLFPNVPSDIPRTQLNGDETFEPLVNPLNSYQTSWLNIESKISVAAFVQLIQTDPDALTWFTDVNRETLLSFLTASSTHMPGAEQNSVSISEFVDLQGKVASLLHLYQFLEMFPTQVEVGSGIWPRYFADSVARLALSTAQNSETEEIMLDVMISNADALQQLAFIPHLMNDNGITVLLELLQDPTLIQLLAQSRETEGFLYNQVSQNTALLGELVGSPIFSTVVADILKSPESQSLLIQNLAQAPLGTSEMSLVSFMDTVRLALNEHLKRLDVLDNHVKSFEGLDERVKSLEYYVAKRLVSNADSAQIYRDLLNDCGCKPVYSDVQPV